MRTTHSSFIRRSFHLLPMLFAALGLSQLIGAGIFGWMLVQESRGPRLVAIMYHRFVSNDAYEKLRGKQRVYALSVDRFREQMQWLRDHGYHAVSLRQALDFIHGRAEIPQPAVLITIDDGCRSVLTRAAPVLMQLNLRATLFLTADPAAPIFDSPEGEHSRLTTTQIAQLDPQVFDLGAHGVTHRPLREMPDDELRRELLDSRTFVEKIAGRSCSTMAVPGNWYDDRVLHYARDSGYEAVFTSDAGAIRPGADVLRLPRLNIAGYTRLNRFETALSPFGMARRRFTSAAGDLVSPALRENVEEMLGEVLSANGWPLVLLSAMALISPAVFLRARRRGPPSILIESAAVPVTRQ